MRGELTRWQQYYSDRSLVNCPVSSVRVRAYINRLLRDGRYPLSKRAVEHLDSTIKLCREKGVEILFFELPISTILRDHLPPGVVDRAREMIRQVCDANAVHFHTIEGLGLSFTDADFAEQSHLNYKGALKLTRSLAQTAVIPVLLPHEVDESE